MDLNQIEMKKSYTRVILFSTLIFWITYMMILNQMVGENDITVHLGWAMGMSKHFIFEIPYPLWHFGTYMLFRLFYIPFHYSAAIFTATVNTISYLLIYFYCNKKAGLNRCPEIAFALSVVTPIYVPWFNPALYLGQGSPTIWHNPTNLMVKPFALVSFVLIVEMLENIKEGKLTDKKTKIIFAIVMSLSVLAKPSFYQGIVPALAVYIIIELIITKFKTFMSYFKFCLLFVPATLVVLFQFVTVFFRIDNAGGVGFGWLAVISGYTPNVYISLLLVLLFPLLYSILNFKKVINTVSLRLSWIYIIVSWLESAILFEDGPRKYDGNFCWASYAAYAVVWVIMTASFFADFKEMDWNDKKLRIKNCFLMIVWFMHVSCGIYYVIALLRSYSFIA